MSDNIMDCSIIVTNLPKEFSIANCEELFSFFNSKSLKFIPNNKSDGNTAFVLFHCSEDAHMAVFSLHERKLLNNYLRVKILRKKSYDTFHSNENNNDQINYANLDSTSGWIKELLSLAPNVDFKQPMKPKLKYKYPKANNVTLTNIVRALYSNEKFYTQTLHLMNKFNFPIPFTSEIMFPGRLIVMNSEEINLKKENSSTIGNLDLMEMEISSGNESEISDTCYSPKIKRRKITFPKFKTVSSTTNYLFNLEPLKKYAIEEVFDKDKIRSENQIKLNVSASLSNINVHPDENALLYVEEEGFGKISEIYPSDDNKNGVLEDIKNNFQLTKIDSNVISDVYNETNIIPIVKPETIMTIEDIKKKTFSSKMCNTIKAFNNYNPGIPSCRLYVKNLAKKVLKDDLVKLYSTFINWEDEEEVKLFSVTLFTQGRMKGQAFINFPSIAISEKALEVTNAFVLFEKPLVVQFAKAIV